MPVKAGDDQGGLRYGYWKRLQCVDLLLVTALMTQQLQVRPMTEHGIAAVSVHSIQAENAAAAAADVDVDVDGSALATL